MLRTAESNEPRPGGARPISSRILLGRLLALFLAFGMLQFSAQPASASASPAHHHFDSRGGTRGQAGRATWCRESMRMTPSETAVLLFAGTLALTGIVMAAVGFLRFQRTPQPAPELFSAGEMVEIYRSSLITAAGQCWSLAVLFCCFLACVLPTPLGDMRIRFGYCSRLAFAFGIGLAFCTACTVFACSLAFSGIPAKIGDRKLEKLSETVGQLECIDRLAPVTEADSAGRDLGS